MAGNRHIIPATTSHVIPVADSMRKTDVDEVLASHGMTPREALSVSLHGSDNAWTVLSPATGLPFAVFGVKRGSVLGDGSVVWLLSTDEIARWRIAFARGSRGYIRALAEKYGVLTNHVDVRNVDSIAWLKWLGADFEEPAPWGVEGRDFQRFTIRREKICA